MMTARIPLVLVTLLLLWLPFGCNDEEETPPTDTGDVTDLEPTETPDVAGFARASLAGLAVTFHEGQGAQKIWEIDESGDQAHFILLGGGLTTTYTYEVTGPNASVLIFDVEGQADRFELTWSSASGGDYTESLDTNTVGSGTFQVD